jgi:hypothetical protein
VAISQSYYANNRTAADATAKLGMQLGVDMTANILKEFWPEIRRKLRAKPRYDTRSGGGTGNSLGGTDLAARPK